MHQGHPRNDQRFESVLAEYAHLEFEGASRPEDLIANPDTAGAPPQGVRAAEVELDPSADRFLRELTRSRSY